LLINLH